MNDSRSLWKMRLLGLGGTALVFAVLIWGVLPRIDATGILPTDKMASAVFVFWRDLPFFDVQKAPAPDGNGDAIYYTVPTRLVTKKEMAQMMGTNAVVHPATPANQKSSDQP